jgi:hypothetical protein
MSAPLGFVLPGLALGAGAVTLSPNPRGFFPAPGPQGPVQPIIAQATVEEVSEDELEITEHPVEVGASISDHSYKRPARVIIHCAWSNSPSPAASIVSQALGIAASVFGNPIRLLSELFPTLSAAQSILTGNNAPSQVKSIYAQLLALQNSRIPFTILTGKRQYKNMLFKSLRVDTSSKFENSLQVTAVCQEVILVTTQVVSLSAAVQANPASNGPTQDQGNQAQQPIASATPDAASTVSGALTAVQSSFGQITSMVSQATDFLTGVQGPLAQLPGAIDEATTALSNVTSVFPTALEIPTIPAAQTLTVPLGVPDLGIDFSNAMKLLPDQLGAAQTALEAAMKQIPSVSAALPAVLSTLAPALAATQGQIIVAVKQLGRIGVN